jgi:hypothetical protein
MLRFQFGFGRALSRITCIRATISVPAPIISVIATVILVVSMAIPVTPLLASARNHGTDQYSPDEHFHFIHGSSFQNQSGDAEAVAPCTQRGSTIESGRRLSEADIIASHFPRSIGSKQWLSCYRFSFRKLSNSNRSRSKNRPSTLT